MSFNRTKHGLVNEDDCPPYYILFYFTLPLKRLVWGVSMDPRWMVEKNRIFTIQLSVQCSVFSRAEMTKVAVPTIPLRGRGGREGGGGRGVVPCKK